MKLKDVTVLHFDFSPGFKGPKIKAMIQLTFEEASKPQIVSVDLGEMETSIILQTARLVERRLFKENQEPIPPEERSRVLEELRDSLQLIEEVKAKYVRGVDIPLQVLKEERRLRRQITELEHNLSEKKEP